MNIRRAKEKDIEKILELLIQVNMVHHHARPDLFKGPATKYTEEQLKKMLAADEDPVFVAVDDSDLVLGYAFCRTEQILDNKLRTDVRTLYLDDLCVDENSRGLHVGGALYRYVLAFARAHGYYNLTLHVWAGNDAAEKFYASQGMKAQFTCLEQIL